MGETGGIIDPQEAVDQLFGTGKAQVIDSATSTTVTESEVIYINDTPVQLVGEDGASLKQALLSGKVPDNGLLSRILASVLGNQVTGISRIDSEVSVTSKVSTKDTLSVVQGGKLITERTAEWSSDSEALGHCADVLTKPVASSPFFNSSGASNASTSSMSSSPTLPSRRTSSNTGTQSPFSNSSANGIPLSGERYRPATRSSLDSSSGSDILAALNIPEVEEHKPNGPGKFPLDLTDLTATLARLSSPEKPMHREGLQYSYTKTTCSRMMDRSSTGAVDTCSTTTQKGTGRPRLLEMAFSQLSRRNSSLTSRDKKDKKNKDKNGIRTNQDHQPSIFGTVADQRNARENTKRSLPQTPKSGKCLNNSPPEWALCTDDDNSLVYEDRVLVSGALGALIQHATPTPSYYPDTAYIFAFLLSARLFIKPHELLQKICDLGFSQQGLKGTDLCTVNKDELGNFLPHLVRLLGQWTETFPYDFRDERVMTGVRSLTHRCIALHPSLRKDVTHVLHSLLNKLTFLEQHEENLSKLTAPPAANTLSTTSDITEVCPSPLTMAQQLTHIELERLSIIGPEEFVQAFAKDNLESSYEDFKKTNNLESYVQWFNRLSYLVATQTCTPNKKKQRVKVIEWWVEVARECFNIGNFNSLMGIIAGLNMSPVSRLKKTWHKVHLAKFSVLEHQMDPTSNFSSYRSTLKAAMWRSAGAVDDRQKIVIPFFSLLVKDLYFLNEGCASRLPNGHINFDKFWQLAKQVTEFMTWKQVTCPFEKVTEVLQYLQTTPILSESGLSLASFESESPDNSYEKERYRNLKSELNASS